MCPGVLKNGTPTGEPAGASPQCRECTAHGMRIGARGCTTEGICKTEDGHDLRRLGLLIVRNGSGTETAGRTEEEAEELLKTMMPRIRELLDPYININEILNRIRAAHENETPEPYIECEIIWNVYAVYSYINGKEIEDIERGIKKDTECVYACKTKIRRSRGQRSKQIIQEGWKNPAIRAFNASRNDGSVFGRKKRYDYRASLP